MDLNHMRPTWAEIDLTAITDNVARLKRLSTARHFMAVVKANGYGHGAVEVADAALKGGADWFGVASVEEAVELREKGITEPILVLGYVAPGQAETVVQNGIRVALWELTLATALDQAARKLGSRAHVHLKIDTGMSRVGRRPGELADLARTLTRLQNVEIEGAFTHFAAADEPGNPYTTQQKERFEAALAELAEAGVRPAIRHAANTAGLLLRPDVHYDLVRAGIGIYGLEPDPGVKWPVQLNPALSWKTRVGMVKRVDEGTSLSYGCTYTSQGQEQIATLPVGYADGYSRFLSNRGEVLIRGRRCQVVGRVCMDQILVKVPTDVPVTVGDEVVLIGRQGEAEVTASEMAQAIGSINYEVVCSISVRVPRFYRPEC